MGLDIRSAGKGSKSASLARPHCGSPKRFLSKALLLGFLTVVAGLAGAREAKCGVTGTLTINNNSSDTIVVYIGVGNSWIVYKQAIQSGDSVDFPLATFSRPPCGFTVGRSVGRATLSGTTLRPLVVIT